jgi:RNA polymerase sigma factor (sigma-70 family)
VRGDVGCEVECMSIRLLSAAIQDLAAEATDAELLAHFLGGRGEALAALVERHAPMVWGVCRRLVPNHHDAEDAFQAAFLVLVRKASGVPRHAVANWLYGVARQTAIRARATAAKRGRREAQVATMPEPTAPEVRDASPALDEELARLPARYRSVVVLCDLEGLTRKEAARQLAVPEGSVASRLARGRALLAKRLARRGVVPAVVAVAAPPALVASTIRAASHPAAGISPAVAALTNGVVRAMFLTKLKSAFAVALVVGLALGGAAALTERTHAAPQTKAEPPAAKGKEPAKEEKLKTLIDKVLAAHGGEEKLTKLTSFTMTVKHTNGETQHYSVHPPKDFRWETTHRDRTGKRIVILSPHGRRWWTKEPNEEAKSFRPSGAEMTMAFWLDYVKFFGPRQVLRLKDADHKLTLLDDESKVGDRPAVGVKVKGPQYDHTMYFDKETHLLVKGLASDIVRVVVFSDYKTFDGIPVAQKERDGHFDPDVTDFKVVDKFDPAVFEKP